MLASRSNAMWVILLASEEEAKQLSGSILMAESVRLLTEYIGTRRIRITVYGVPVDIREYRMETFYAKYRQVDEVSAVINKSGIATGDIVFQVTMTRQRFGEIPNVLMCRGKKDAGSGGKPPTLLLVM